MTKRKKNKDHELISKRPYKKMPLHLVYTSGQMKLISLSEPYETNLPKFPSNFLPYAKIIAHKKSNTLSYSYQTHTKKNSKNKIDLKKINNGGFVLWCLDSVAKDGQD